MRKSNPYVVVNTVLGNVVATAATLTNAEKMAAKLTKQYPTKCPGGFSARARYQLESGEDDLVTPPTHTP